MGALAGARYWDDDVMVAVILGTGTNACYVELVDAIPKLQGPKSRTGTTVCVITLLHLFLKKTIMPNWENNHQIINTEWGAFSTGLPLTEFDREMDAASINPGEQVINPALSIPHFPSHLSSAFPISYLLIE